MEIGVVGRPVDQVAKAERNIILSTATFGRADGTTGTLADVALAFRPSAAARSNTALVSMREALRNGFGEGGAGESGTADGLTPDQRRIMGMPQAMASFGTRDALDSHYRSNALHAPLDWAVAGIV